MSFVNPAFTPCEQGPSAIRTAFAAAHKRYLAHLVDHPGWFGVNLLWYFIGLFGGPQMRILGGFIMKVNFFLWLHPDVYLWSRFYQHQGTLGEGSWVNVNLLDNPSWLSNPRYSTIPPYIVLAFCLVLDSSVGFLVPFLTPKQGISKYGMSWEAWVTWFPRFLAVFQFPYPWGMKFSSTRYLRSLT